MKHDYWLKQTSKQPAFPDVEWNRPQQASRAGRLAIVGGAGLHFFGVTSSFEAHDSTHRLRNAFLSYNASR